MHLSRIILTNQAKNNEEGYVTLGPNNKIKENSPLEVSMSSDPAELFESLLFPHYKIRVIK